MKNLPYLLTFLLVAILLWSSFRSASITTQVTGKVIGHGEALRSVEVSILDNEGKPLGYYEPTNENGEYALMFNAVEGRIMKLKFEKEGYTTLIQDYIPQSGKRHFNFQDVHLVKIVPDYALSPSYKLQNINNDQSLKIKLYDSVNSIDTNFVELDFERIEFFTHIQRRHFLNQPAIGTWYTVTFKLKDRFLEEEVEKEKITAFLFEPKDIREYSFMQD